MIVLCTHLLEEAEVLGDEIFFLSKGQIVVGGTLSGLKRQYGLGYSIKVYKRSEASDAELSSVEDYLRRMNRRLFGKSLKVKYFKTFLRVDIAREQKAQTKHVLKTLELFFARDFDFYLNSTSLDDVYFNISEIIRSFANRQLAGRAQAPALEDAPDALCSGDSMISVDSRVQLKLGKEALLETDIFSAGARETLASKVYIVAANRLEFLVKNKIQLIYYFSSVVVHLVNFYFGCVFFGQDVFLYYAISFFAIDVALSSYFLYGLVYEKTLRIKHFLLRKGFSPLEYFLSKFFVDWLLASFQFAAFFAEVIVFYQEYRIKSRNLIFLLIGLYLWKVQFLASSYLLSHLPWKLAQVHSRLTIFYCLSFVFVLLLVYLFFELFGILPTFLVAFSETAYICLLLNVKMESKGYSTDKLIINSIPFQLVFIVLSLALAVFIERRNLAYNYVTSEPEAPDPSSASRKNSLCKESSGNRQSGLSRESENDSLNSENEEEVQQRMLTYLKTEQEYFLTVEDNLLVRVSGLKKRYAKKEVVDLTFGIEPGICLGVVGPNGAGKTTAINLLLSVIKKTAGEICFSRSAQRKASSAGTLGSGFRSLDADADAEATKPYTGFWREKCGVCFQEESLWNELTVEQHVEFLCRLFNIEDFARVTELLRYFDMLHLLDREVYKLSSGERKKLLVVMNLVNRSSLYFLDETSANLDPDSREDLRKVLNKLKLGYGATIVTTTHFVKGGLTRGRNVL